MSKLETKAQQKLKAWMISHARKNELIQQMAIDIEVLENQIKNVTSNIKKHYNEQRTQSNNE